MERFEFQFSTVTEEPPTGSQVRVDAADMSAVRKVWARVVTSPGEDVFRLLRLLGSGDSLWLQDYDDHTRGVSFNVSGPPVDKGGYLEIPVMPDTVLLPLLSQKITLGTLAAGEGSAPSPEYVSHAYATVDQLAPLLNLSPPTASQAEGMQRVLDAAAAKIDWEIPYNTESPAPSPPPPLVVQVNLAHAVELWRQAWTGFGLITLSTDVGPILTARDPWYRHARTLAPLKKQWGVA